MNAPTVGSSVRVYQRTEIDDSQDSRTYQGVVEEIDDADHFLLVRFDGPDSSARVWIDPTMYTVTVEDS